MGKELQEYYINLEIDPKFEDLTFDDKYRISQTLGFAGWRMAKAGRELQEALGKLFPKGIIPQ